MRIARRRPKGAKASFGLAIILLGLSPVRLGPQDLASLLARQPGLTERWRDHLIASPFGTINAATFSFPRPPGAAIPRPVGYRLASLGPDVTGAIDARALFEPYRPEAPQFPFIDRTRKGDRLGPPRPEIESEAAPVADQGATEQGGAPARRGTYTLASVSPVPDDLAPADLHAPIAISPPDTVRSGEQPAPETAAPKTGAPATEAEIPPAAPDGAELESSEPDLSRPTLDEDVSPAVRTARIYFGVETMAGMSGSLQPWEPGQHSIFDDGIAALDVPASPAARTGTEAGKAASAEGGETIAGKGEVTGEGRRPRSPAERLGLSGKARARAEKCLADAVYFESRGETVRGQIAVAQVVMNRVFSGYYPDNVCGVVYQNAHRHLACQFTFACDGIPDRVNEADAWERAKRIARDTLDGKYWLNDVGKATHYHAYWVHPWWVRTMRKLDRIGVHTFYRPRKWGDGSDTPVWGDPAATREAAKKL